MRSKVLRSVKVRKEHVKCTVRPDCFLFYTRTTVKSVSLENIKGGGDVLYNVQSYA